MNKQNEYAIYGKTKFPYILLLLSIFQWKYGMRKYNMSDDVLSETIIVVSFLVFLFLDYLYTLFGNVVIEDGCIKIRLLNVVLKKYNMQEYSVKELGKGICSNESDIDYYYAILLTNKNTTKTKKIRFYSEKNYQNFCKALRNQISDNS